MSGENYKLKPLAQGDIVDIIAPASGCSQDEYKKAIDFIKEFGLTPRTRAYESLIKDGLCANSVDYRFEHLIESLESKESKAVWCLNGGYGSQQLLEKLNGLSDVPEEKMFIGFSDISILLNYFADKWGWTTIHGPMPGQVGKVTDNTWVNLADVVFGRKKSVIFTAIPLNNAARVKGLVNGKFIGGCLSLMQAFIGTAEMPSLENGVLFLEDDRFETPKRIDRIFDQMMRAGVFFDVEAVVLGNFLENVQTGSKDDLELQEVLKRLSGYLDERGIPLIQNIKLGHTEDMLTVLIGANAEIKLGDKPEVIIRG